MMNSGSLRKFNSKDGSQCHKNLFINNNNNIDKASTFKAHNVNKVDNNSSSNSQRIFKCYLCNKNHFISCFNSFKEKTPSEHFDLVKSSKLCTNCLGKHLLKDCKIKKPCSKCNQRHHTFIHKTVCKDTDQRLSSNTDAPIV